MNRNKFNNEKNRPLKWQKQINVCHLKTLLFELRILAVTSLKPMKCMVKPLNSSVLIYGYRLLGYVTDKQTQVVVFSTTQHSIVPKVLYSIIIFTWSQTMSNFCSYTMQRTPKHYTHAIAPACLTLQCDMGTQAFKSRTHCDAIVII